MKAYRIVVNSIDGIYEGNSEKEAIDNYAKDAGYKSYDHMIKQIPHLTNDEMSVTEIPAPRTSSDALALGEDEWELFARHNAGITNIDDTDGNGLHLEDVLSKRSRQDILKYLGWY